MYLFAFEKNTAANFNDSEVQNHRFAFYVYKYLASKWLQNSADQKTAGSSDMIVL